MHQAPAPRSFPSRKETRLSDKAPVFEHIVLDDMESFLWRCDDYPWERNVWNIHPEIEIHLVRNASGIALVGDHIGPFDPGHLAVVGSSLPHDWVTALPPGEVIRKRDIVVQFHPDRIRAAQEIFPELAGIEPFLLLASRGLSFQGETQRLGGEILQAMGTVDGLERLTLFLRLLHLLSSSPEYQILSSEDFSPETDAWTLRSVQTALAYIFENFRSEIRLSDIARRLGMSEWACSRFLKKNSGNSFTDYLTMLRIGQACKLLAESDMPITAICFEVGYSNVSNFNRTFRHRRGMTPSAYRRLAERRVSVPFQNCPAGVEGSGSQPLPTRAAASSAK